MRVLTLLESIGDGIISLPETLWHGIERTGRDLGFDGSQPFEEAWAQNWRLLKLLEHTVKYVVRDYRTPLVRSVEIIFKNYYETLPECAKRKINNAAGKKVAYLGGKIAVNAIVVKEIAKKISDKLMKTTFFTRIPKLLIKEAGLILSIQGTIYKSAQASERLKAKFPKIWLEMKKHDLDMLYFLIEKPMQKYLNAIRMNKMLHGVYQSKVKSEYCK